MLPSTSGSPPQAAHGQARRRNCRSRYDSIPSFHRIANSVPICWTLVGSRRIEPEFTMTPDLRAILALGCPTSRESGENPKLQVSNPREVQTPKFQFVRKDVCRLAIGI